MKRYSLVRHRNHTQLGTEPLVAWEALEEHLTGGWVRYEDLPQWSSNLDARPPEGVLVLVHGLDGYHVACLRTYEWPEGILSEGSIGRGTRFEDIRGDVVSVTHWMPLPEGPK